MASVDPLRMRRTTCPDASVKSRPLIRVVAEKGTKMELLVSNDSARNPKSFLARITIERPSGVSSEREAN